MNPPSPRVRFAALELVVAHSHAHGDHVAGDTFYPGRLYVRNTAARCGRKHLGSAPPLSPKPS